MLQGNLKVLSKKKKKRATSGSVTPCFFLVDRHINVARPITTVEAELCVKLQPLADMCLQASKV